MSSHHLERFYNLSASTKQMLSPQRLCDQLIHSFQFVPVTDEPQHRLEGLLFNSDRTRREGLFFIEWPEFARFVTAVAQDGIVSLSVDRLTEHVVKLREPPLDQHAQ